MVAWRAMTAWLSILLAMDNSQDSQLPSFLSNKSIRQRRRTRSSADLSPLNQHRRSYPFETVLKPPSSQPEKYPDKITISVCQSPGCVADGSQAALERMQALAPANVVVKPGSCVSFCGAGPVMMEERYEGEDGAQKLVELKHKRVKDDTLLEKLYGDNVPKDLVEGYDLVKRGDAAFGKKSYAEAVRFYEQALSVSFQSAVQLVNERDRLRHHWLLTEGSRSSTKTRVPVSLEWLIRARRNEAMAKLELRDADGAMLAAQASCNLSRNTSAESFMVLAEVYRKKGDAVGELQALQKMFSLPLRVGPLSEDDQGNRNPIEESALPFAQQNQRRLARIRLQKLEQEAS